MGKRKAHFDYPCTWVYKVIGSDQESMKRAVAEIIGGETCSIQLSNSSKTGKYHCLDVELVVSSEEHRVSIYDCLRKHPEIKIVL